MAADPDVRLVAVSAWAGTGKTALVTHWVQKGGIARRSGLQGVFGWSFYTDPSAERWAAGFLNWARSDLGVPVPETGPVAWRVLGVLVAAPVLLVLDGLEVVQEGPAAEGFGRLLDGLLREVLTGTCQLPHAGLVLLTSRFPFADLETFDGRSARILELPGFTPAEGAALLAAEGGTWLGEDERRELAAAVDGHALAVAVLGQLLAARPPSGDLAALREELATAAGTDIRVSKLLDFYSGQLGEADRYLLAGVSLFTHPVTADAALAVAAHEAFGGQLEGWTSAMVQTAVRTRLSGLATWHRDGTLSVHSLVRDTFRPLAIPAAATAAAYGDISLTGATPHSWATMTRPSGDPVTIAAPPQPAPEPTTARRRRTYVNVGFAAAENARQVIEPDHLAPGHDVWVWVEIGPRVVGAVPGDVQPIDPAVVKDLDEVEVVLFPDAGLIVAPDPAVGRLGVTASGPFRVREPAAIPPQAGLPTARRLFFTLTTPAQPGNYRLRCAVYAKGLLLHVEQLTVVVGPSRRSISARTTFRLVRDLAAVDQSEIHEHRLSIYANAQPDGSHAFSFRGADGRSFFTRQVRLGDSDVNTTLTFARAALHHASWRSDKKYDGQSSKYDEHSRGGFAPDLAAADVIDLARSGYNLWLQFAEQLPSDEGEAAASPEPADNNLHALRDLMCKPGGAVQLAPIKGPDLIVPIQLFYDRLLDSSENAPLQMCSNGAAWIGSSAAELPCLAGCSEPNDPNRVCPAGFWGLRHLVSVTPEPRAVCRRRGLPPKVSLKSGLQGVAGFTTDEEVLGAAGQHENTIQELLKVRQAAHSLDEFKAELKTVPAQVVYFLCHVANYEKVPELVLGPIDGPGINYGTLVDLWTPNLCAGSPLVVLNACNSAAPSPERLLGLVAGFLRRGAAGAIGTEITVFVSLAVPFAEHFLQSFVNGVSLGEAIRRARVAMLARGNPLGLAYIAFGLPQLALLPD